MRRKHLGFHVSVVAVCLIALAPYALAKTVTVVRKDGRTFTGELVSEGADVIKIRIKDNPIPLPIARDDIRELTVEPSVQDWYTAERAKLANGDVEGRLKLASKLIEKEAFELADKELAGILEIDPNNTEANLRRRIVKARIEQLKKEAQAQNNPPRQGNTEPRPRPPVGVGPKPAVPAKAGELPTERLTEKDVNVIRLYEYNFDERTKPNVIIPKPVIEQMFDKYQDNERVPKGAAAHSAFLRKQGWEQLKLLFELSARELWQQADVKGDPEAMRTFRTIVHPRYVLNYCGTVGCHGGNNFGGLYLFRNDPNGEETVYTNFYILNSYQNSAGYMIDRNEPDRSLLLQYGMRPEDAKTPHPDVPGFRPALKMGPQDRQYSVVHDWIGKQLYKPAPTYPIEYKLPEKPAKPDQPVVDPAAAPGTTKAPAPGTTKAPAPGSASKAPAPAKATPKKAPAPGGR
jgi:hypothetical protein